MINLTAKLDNDEFQRRLREMRDSARGVTNSIVKDAQRIDTTWQGVASSLKGSEGFGAKLLQGLKPIVPQVEAIRNGVKGIRVDFERFPTIPSLQSLPETTASAARGFNALNFATQQLVREVPAATMGLHMFFLAISNNLPFFADAIKQVREENKALAASGKPTVSVFKQIIGSIFSWQTALIAGITALTLYGKEIGNWVKGLFKGKEALDAVARAEKTLADVRRQGMLDAQEEVTQVKLAVKAMQDSNRSLDERKRAMRTLQDQYPEYFGKLEEEQMLYGEVGDSVDVLIQKMVSLATARKSFDKLVENEEKLALLKDTKGYAEWEKANEAFEGVGRKYEFKQQVGGRASDYVWKDTREGMIFDKAQAAFLENLEEGGEETEALFKEISDKYDGDVNAYIKAIEESNKKLTEEASALITTPDLSEDKAAAEERKRKAEAALAEAEREAEERKRAIQRLNNDLSKEVQRTQREMDDAEIATIKDGIERKRREIQAGYERRAAEIDKYEADIKAAQGGELTPEQKGHISYLRQANTDTLMAGKVLVKAMQDEAAQEATDAMNEYLASYGTFQERLVAITAKYSRLIAEAETEGERKALETERDAILAEYEVRASEWAQELVDKTAEQLTTMADKLQSVLDGLQTDYDALDTSDSEEAKQLLQTINMLKAQIKVLKEQLGDASKAVNDDNWAEATQVFQNIANTANEAAEGISEYNEEAGMALSGMAQLASFGIDLIGTLRGVQKAFKKTGEAASAMEKASAILAVISLAIKAVSGIFNIMNANKEATRNATLAAYEYSQALKEIANIELRESFSSMFGKEGFGEFSALLTEAQKQLQELEDTKKKLAETEESAVKNLGANTSIWGNFGGLRGKMNDAKSLDTALVADMRSGWQKFWGSGNDNIKTTSLEEFYEDGKLNVDKLKAYYDQYKDYLTDEQADLVKSLIDTGELYEENMAAINDYMSSIFGELGTSITNSLVDAFRNGTDAATAMGDAVSGVMEQIATDMAHAAFIQPLLNEAQDAINALNAERGASGLSDEEYMRRLMEISSGLMSDATAQGEAMTQYLDNLKRMAAEQGIDIFESDTQKQQATSKGFQAMSQETGSELNGRFTDIQGQAHRIAEAVEFCRNIQVEKLGEVQSINNTVAMIHNDTSLIANHTKALASIKEDISTIRKALDNGVI